MLWFNLFSITKKCSKVQFWAEIAKVFLSNAILSPSNQQTNLFSINFSIFFLLSILVFDGCCRHLLWQKRSNNNNKKIVYLQFEFFIRIDASVMAAVAGYDTLTSLQRHFKIENIFYYFFLCCCCCCCYFTHMSSIQNNASNVYYWYFRCRSHLMLKWRNVLYQSKNGNGNGINKMFWHTFQGVLCVLCTK